MQSADGGVLWRCKALGRAKAIGSTLTNPGRSIENKATGRAWPPVVLSSKSLMPAVVKVPGGF